VSEDEVEKQGTDGLFMFDLEPLGDIAQLCTSNCHNTDWAGRDEGTQPTIWFLPLSTQVTPYHMAGGKLLAAHSRREGKRQFQTGLQGLARREGILSYRRHEAILSPRANSDTFFLRRRNGHILLSHPKALGSMNTYLVVTL
jgi:hypothetical protein